MAGYRCDTDELLDNLYDYGLPESGEEFETLLSHKNIKILRIVSSDNLKPTEYMQDEDEWVVLIRGSARLTINGNEIEMRSGDCLFIPSHTPHTVLSVEDGTLWLAVHIY